MTRYCVPHRPGVFLRLLFACLAERSIVAHRVLSGGTQQGPAPGEDRGPVRSARRPPLLHASSLRSLIGWPRRQCCILAHGLQPDKRIQSRHLGARGGQEAALSLACRCFSPAVRSPAHCVGTSMGHSMAAEARFGEHDWLRT